MGFNDDINNGFLFFDGAMGTMLQKAGLKSGQVPEEWNIDKADQIQDIHRQYLDAGANIITTNTFGANSYKLKDSKYSPVEIIEAGVLNAKIIGSEHYVALDIGPIGQLLEPVGTLSFDQAYEIFKQQVIAGSSAGADLILIETISDLYEAKAAILAAKENSDLPILCTMTFDDNSRTLNGTDAITMVEVLQGLGVDCLGINCSLGPDKIGEIAKDIFKYSRIPVLIQPNAGLPEIVDTKTRYSLSVSEFADQMQDIAKIGGTIFGGCCGTDPTYIKELVKRFEGLKPVINNNPIITTTTSSTKTIIFDNNIKVIGERINPSGKKALKNALLNDDISYVLKEAINQIDHGADILDINLGLNGINESELMVKVIKEIQSITDIPLQIDSMKGEVIEQAVRYYNGKPIINSVNGKQRSLDKILPIAKKYGALIIGLTLDEEGLPETVEKRIEIAYKIINEAKKYGIPKENIIMDCLTLTASAKQNSINDTLKAIKIIKDKYGVKTTLGASNVSFGLPNRELLNKIFLTMAMTYGLDAPITDPTINEIMDTIRGFRVLNNIDSECKAYVDHFGNKEIKTSASKIRVKSIRDIIINGLRDDIEIKIKKLLDDKVAPLSIINEHLIPALDIVGQRYEDEDIFLPQLIRSAETVKIAFGFIKDTMSTNESSIFKGAILLATVKGDVHDIGKNIVKILLENYGYDVIDLGKDVDKEIIYEKALKHNIRLIGLSALMTTTVANMEEIIDYVRERKADIEFMVGGAVLTEEYSLKIGAKYYGRDAREAVNIAQRYFK